MERETSIFPSKAIWMHSTASTSRPVNTRRLEEAEPRRGQPLGHGAARGRSKIRALLFGSLCVWSVCESISSPSFAEETH